jgi:hypothetical protein
MNMYWTVRFYAWRSVIDAAAFVQDVAHRAEKRARRAIGGGHRPHRTVKCGACSSTLYDDHTGSVYSALGWCKRCGTASHRSVCDRCVEKMYGVEQVLSRNSEKN